MESPEALFERVFPNESSSAKFQRLLIDWFESSGRSYPWRETTDPYAILVSELMLQQTQIATVLGRGYFTRWMQRFPNWETLAAADEASVLKAWEGLGYYNRARNLQRAAIEVMTRHGGECPREIGDLLALPGVGRYTAGAVKSFAFDDRAPIVDGNVVRVFARLFAYREPVDTPAAQRVFWAWAEQLTPQAEIRAYNSAIMELGQRHCAKSSPSCSECPVADYCIAHREGIVDEIPRKKGKTQLTKVSELVGLVVKDGRVLVVPESGGRRKGLWKLPAVSSELAADLVEVFRFDYPITRYKVTLQVFALPSHLAERVLESETGKWVDYSEDANLPALGSPYRKAIRKYRETQNNFI